MLSESDRPVQCGNISSCGECQHSDDSNNRELAHWLSQAKASTVHDGFTVAQLAGHPCARLGGRNHILPETQVLR